MTVLARLVCGGDGGAGFAAAGSLQRLPTIAQGGRGWSGAGGDRPAALPVLTRWRSLRAGSPRLGWCLAEIDALDRSPVRNVANAPAGDGRRITLLKAA